MNSEYDVDSCAWCRGDGKDHGTLGMTVVRDCPRCEGSGRVYVTARESVTGRRRVYKGPAFVEAATARQARSADLLSQGSFVAAATPEATVSAPRQVRRDKTARPAPARKMGKTPKRNARSHAA